ncbi:hypothetical protein ACWM35_03350 [Neobacillus sp. K501]
MDEEVQNKERSDGDRFNRFMFGPGRAHHTEAVKEKERSNPSSPDIVAILENVDSLMKSAQNLKPLINKVYPLVERFWKKK